ncbi:MscL family protein [Patescibacteria group bacterium]|nr:MscL family protein [Patescibacteria group bacterium]MCG2702668.1 MscL family protein [Candidatus Parcubacteria bacterium]MBU4264877.1 MscL family protein [Patescibacteria group bacterium]MBU4389748.1 MscL family protein [Patescibacteria group bacterium]MBU4396927.1 MscL family protein [Patescibacteria group bacterium]
MKTKNPTNPKDFINFLKKNNVLGLAIGVVIANAAKDLVTSIVNNLIMPFVGIFTPNGSWRQISFTIVNSQFKVGELIGAFVDFFIIAFTVYFIMKKLLKIDDKSIKVKKQKLI